MTISKNTFIDAYGIDLNDDLSGQFAEQEPRNDNARSEISRQSAHAYTRHTARLQRRFDEPQPHATLRGPHFRVAASEPATQEAAWADMTVIDVGAGWSAQPDVRAPASEVNAAPALIETKPPSEPTPVPETPVPETTAPETTAPETTAPETTAPETPVPEIAAPKITVAQTASQSNPGNVAVSQPTPVAETEVETVDEVASSAAQPTPEPTPTPIVQKEVAATPVTETETVTETVTETAEAGGVDHDVPAEAKVEETKSLPAPTPVVPAWEVDRFAWPTDIEALFEEQTDYFEHAGHKLLAASREGLSTLAITSARPGEGTTTVTLCLARAVAAVGGRVAVLDGNLSNAQIGRTLSLEFASGWQVAAAGTVELAEAAIAGLEERITLFPAAAAAEGVNRLADESVRDVLRRAAEGFDLLLIDAGQDDFGENATQIDAAMVVRDVRRTSEQQSLAAALSLREAGVKAVGIAENFIEPHESAAAA